MLRFAAASGRQLIRRVDCSSYSPQPAHVSLSALTLRSRNPRLALGESFSRCLSSKTEVLPPTSSLAQANYHRDVFYAKPSDGSLVNEDSVREIVQTMVPRAVSVAAQYISVSVVVGGITNSLFKATFSASDQPAVLVRVFGGEGMIDRDLENATFKALSDSGVGTEYFGRFGNGRVEGWIEGAKDITLSQMAAPEVMSEVAVQLARLHAYSLPAELQAFYAQPGMWPQLWSWLEQAKQDAGSMEQRWGGAAAERWRPIQIELFGEHFEKAEQELTLLQKAIPTDAPTVFAHNDLLAGNIMVNAATGQTHLIDFEYGGCNYRGFDIANHWNEWAGGTQKEMNGVPEYERFPTSEQQRAFCSAYLLEAVGDDSGVEALLAESNKFVLANHWYWGLWAVNQAVIEGTAEFDYVRYAEERIRRYFKTK